ncbi:RagB/SusD family nutrient uptake outer membrane protein [Plebeiibacterium marinum]|uniref:RagB/SusD family nutrient uptake outer membrane protein n=1 Tax=Plebeiibacterium marinum TaxID=2992111 RepID=A0AAE3MH71_9BACT|nr:RagB/SusD family nutrient uptake outer membrane protein [Plebeiobacterium marinum]MCW3807524.1 RagB/SusD family nutrient uptake outer membrane protein [Plebeiobacterium marinum]
MNKFFSIIMTGLLIISSGCTDWLDIRPDSEVVLEDFWKNESQVEEVLAACYKSLTTDDVMQAIMVWSELRSDNVVSGDGMKEDMVKMLNFDITARNGYCGWGAMYQVINYCNTFLYYAPEVVNIDENFTEVELHSLEAEVMAIRALAYFYLVRTFKDVPYITTPSIEDNQEYTVAKSTEQDVLNYLISDLEYALRYANNDFKILEYNKGRVTKNMVCSLLADIYLWQEDYANCVKYCDLVLADQTLELEDSEDFVRSVFLLGNSSESIFELQFNEDVQKNNKVYDFYGGSGNTLGEWAYPYILVEGNYSPFEYNISNEIEGENDIRKYEYLIADLGSEKYSVLKYTALRYQTISGGYSQLITYKSGTANWIVYRLADIMLMKAEALIQQNDFADALELINTTFLRSNPDLEDKPLVVSDYTTKLDQNNLLLRERQRELMFEGKRWFDLMRLARREGRPSSLLNYVAKKFSGAASMNINKLTVMDALYLPIHIDEINANSALEQNPFYDIQSDEDITR